MPLEITVRQSNQLKSIAILMMLCLHLFNRDYKGLFDPILFIANKPLVYYISLFCDACVPIFAFVSGYGLYYKYLQNRTVFAMDNLIRLKKLYINYWIILLIFPVTIGLILQFPGYPGSWDKFVFNFLGVNTNYNGAWWFFTVYVFFLLTSRLWFSILDNFNAILVFIILIGIYFLAFYFRVYKAHLFESLFLNFLQSQLSNFFCTLFQFMLGAFALKYKWNNIVSSYFKNIQHKKILISVFILMLVIFHSIIPNFVVAPFTALGFIFVYCQMDISKKNQKIIDFFTPHSTNIWLIHMFIYLTFFRTFIYSFKYPVIIFFVLVLICVLCSFFINFINKIVQKSIL